MRLLTPLKTICTTAVIALLGVTGLASHAVAVSGVWHSMNGMNHQSEDRALCVVQCQTGVVARDNDSKGKEKNRQDDEPAPPQPYPNQHSILEEKLTTKRLYSLAIDPPLKVPAYILYGVFRT